MLDLYYYNNPKHQESYLIMIFQSQMLAKADKLNSFMTILFWMI